MVRRMIAGMLSVANGDATLSELEDALTGGPHDFGSVSPLPLILMDVRSEITFRVGSKPKVVEDLDRRPTDMSLRLADCEYVRGRAGATPRLGTREGPACS